MYSTKQFRTGIVAALVALAPALASAQGGTAQNTQQQGQGGGGGDQAAVRQHLGEARTALAELTKLPAAAQLQGAQRDAVAKLISDFNAFATATSDWRSKYQVVDDSLNKLLAESGGTGAAPSAPSDTPPSAGTPPSTTTPEGTAPAGDGALDPTIVEKLKEVRTALDNFEQASGDPVFMVEGIEKVLEEASTGSGSVTLNQTQLDQIRSYLEKIRKAATR